MARPVKLLNLPGIFPVEADGKTEKDPNLLTRLETGCVGVPLTDNAALKQN